MRDDGCGGVVGVFRVFRQQGRGGVVRGNATLVVWWYVVVT